MDNTECLYHYTSIDSLALILKNRTIRLNQLDKMDDLQEQKTADVKNLGKFVFVSSWTDNPQESIPMWKMYTNSVAGVRIKLRKNPFIWHHTSALDVAMLKLKGLVLEQAADGLAHTFINVREQVNNGYYCVETYTGNILTKVTYTDEKSLLEPRVCNKDAGSMQLELGAMGKYKSKYWSFQDEWRYKMICIPVYYHPNTIIAGQKNIEIARRIANGTALPPFQYYDLDIAENAFSAMEITCSPQMSIENRDALKILVEKYNPTAKILESDLLGNL